MKCAMVVGFEWYSIWRTDINEQKLSCFVPNLCIQIHPLHRQTLYDGDWVIGLHLHCVSSVERRSQHLRRVSSVKLSTVYPVMYATLQSTNYILLFSSRVSGTTLKIFHCHQIVDFSLLQFSTVFEWRWIFIRHDGDSLGIEDRVANYDILAYGWIPEDQDSHTNTPIG